MPKVKTITHGRSIKNELAKPINGTPENVMMAVLQSKPKATAYWYKRTSVKKPK